MGLQRLNFGVRSRKFMFTSVKICCRSVWNHPFLVGVVCFFMFLYTSFPLLFSALVTASPVLISTAVLLGTLLSFGSPYIPEIDDEKVSHEVSELKTGVAEDHIVLERDVGDGDDFVVERHAGKRWDTVENAEEKVNLVDNEVSEVEEGDGSVRYNLLEDDDLDSRDIHCQDGVVDEVERSSNNSSVEKKREIREEILGNEGLLSVVEASDDHVLADVVGDHKLKKVLCDEQGGDESDSSPVFSWKRPVDDEDDGDGDDDESLHSDSDGAESSSPDASMADFIPMLDELHPLLGSGTPQPAQLSDDGSDAASERSHGSTDDESMESDNQGEEDNDEEEEEGGGGGKGDKEDESKSAIKWTEDDQKNLMDLGFSELERNQRLGNLIARRRARKNMTLMIEKNLIDLDIPLNIAPISTTRRNPFELPYHSYDDLGLPPIPGSAPSIMQPRRNPFDLPYDSSEEKPDLKGDSFQEEFAGFNQRETVPQREAFLRRHESFNVGPSSLGVSRQDLKWKPFFSLEQLVTGGASPSLFRRQWSEVSESKLSSVPDTESVFSVVDDDNKPCEQDISQETELIANEYDERENLSFGDVEQVENRVALGDVVEIAFGDGENRLETESSLPEAGAATALVELNGIEIEPSHVGQAESRDAHHDVIGIASGDRENQQEMESTLSEAGTTHVELNPSEIHLRTDPVDEDFSRSSSLSSFSEIGEKISDIREGSTGVEPRGHETKDSDISTQPSFEESEFRFFSREVDDNQHSEPVYDSSPSVEMVLSFSSLSSEAQAETSEMGSCSMIADSTDKEPEGVGETTEQGTSGFQVLHTASSDSLENEPRAKDLPEISECEFTYAASSGVSSTFADHNVSMAPESVVEYVPTNAGSSSSDEGSGDNIPIKEESSTQNQVDLLSHGAEMNLFVDQGMDKMLDSSPEEQLHPSNTDESSEAEPGDTVDEEDTRLERNEIHPSSSSDHDLVGGGVSPAEEIVQTGGDQMHSSNIDASLDVDGHCDKGEQLSSNNVSSSISEEHYHIVGTQVDPSVTYIGEVHENGSEMDLAQPTLSDSKTGTGLDHDMNSEGIALDSSYEAMPCIENPSAELKNQLSGSDNSTDEPHIDELDQLQEPPIIATESRREVDIGNNGVDVHKVHGSESKLSTTSYTSRTSESTCSPAESPEHTLPTDHCILNEMESEGGDLEERSKQLNIDEGNISEEDGVIKEIDEVILSESDAVGELNVEKIEEASENSSLNREGKKAKSHDSSSSSSSSDSE